MGFMDKIGGLFGGKKAAPETVKGPSTVLREHGIDPSDLKFSFNQDGSVTVAGRAADQAECDRICEVVGEMAQVKSVNNEIIVGAPEPAPVVEAAPVEAPVEAPVAEEAQPAETADEDNTYTVEAGDTLWAIAEKVYGSGGKYMKIFEANTDLLKNPDQIFPGQKLKIPD